MAKDTQNETNEKLMNGKELLERAFDDNSRPSIQWLRQHTGREIPAVKIGRLYFYDLEKVRAALKAV